MQQGCGGGSHERVSKSYPFLYIYVLRHFWIHYCNLIAGLHIGKKLVSLLRNL